MAKRRTPTRPPKPTGNQRTGPQSTPAGTGGIPVVAVPARDPAVAGPACRRHYGPSVYALAAAAGGPRSAPAGLPPCPEGDYETYRRMWLTDPTIRIGRAAFNGPILAAGTSYAKRDDGVPDAWVDWVRDVYKPLLAGLKAQMLLGMDFGSRSFEQTAEVVPDGPGLKLKFKPLRPELTRPLVDPTTGAYAGLRNGRVDLKPEETLHWAYQNEDDNYYGVSVLEGVREWAWWPWVCAAHRLELVNRRNSNIVPVIKGPLSATEYDKDGKEIKGTDQGQEVLDNLTEGIGVAVENLVAGADDLAAVPELAKASKWVLESFDKGAPPTAADAIVGQLKYWDALKMRGILVPERVATQGEHGTNAESETQTDVALLAADQVALLIYEAVQRHSVDRWLAWRFGERARGAVLLQPEPLTDEKRALYKWVIGLLLANPAIADVLVTRLGLDPIFERVGIPVRGSADLDEGDGAAPGGGTAAGGGRPGGAQGRNGDGAAADPAAMTDNELIAHAASLVGGG
jgi:hypothetical protein